MTFTELSNSIFVQVINDYHKADHVDTPINNPFEEKTIEYFLYLKNAMIIFLIITNPAGAISRFLVVAENQVLTICTAIPGFTIVSLISLQRAGTVHLFNQAFFYFFSQLFFQGWLPGRR